MGSEDSVEAREEGGSRRSSVGEDDRYSQKISAINEGYREKHIIITHGTLAYRLWHPFHQPSSQKQKTHKILTVPQPPKTHHKTWNLESRFKPGETP